LERQTSVDSDMRRAGRPSSQTRADAASMKEDTAMNRFLAPVQRRGARRATATALALALAFALAIPAPARADGCSGASAQAGEASSAEVGRATLCLLNRERADHGLGRLRSNRRLALAARRHARDMVRRRYFAHDSLSGTDFVARIRRTGYTTGRRWRLGENLAWAAGGSGTPEAVVRMWMESPGHRANVLGDFREVGVGLAQGAPLAGHPEGVTYATEYGARL
jgi:uncharacterized protein YkwD